MTGEESLKPDRKFYPLKVKAIHKETPSASSISFELDAAIADKFRFIQGQYLTFKIQLNGEEYRRSYSICSATGDNDLRVAVKELENGTVSKYLNRELKVGDRLETMLPQGNFHTSLSSSNKKNYMAFAAGSGITPVLSIIKTTLNTEIESTFLLHYGNQKKEEIIFKDELDQLVKSFEGRFKISHYLSREDAGEGFVSGRINPSTLVSAKSLGLDWEKADEYFLCGPQEMINSMKSYLEEKGISNDHIHYELFTSDGAKNELDGPADKDVPTFVSSAVEIILDEESTHLDLKTDGSTILEAAIQAGIDPPYSCRGGVCTTCMARLKSGTVKMDMNHALTDGEIKDGYILTCQSHPTTEKVVISYDDI